MRWVYLLGRAYPYWAVPATIGFFQFWLFYHRRKEKPRYFCGLMVAFFAITTLLWFVYRGDIHSDQWVREWFES